MCMSLLISGHRSSGGFCDGGHKALILHFCGLFWSWNCNYVLKRCKKVLVYVCPGAEYHQSQN